MSCLPGLQVYVFPSSQYNLFVCNQCDIVQRLFVGTRGHICELWRFGDSTVIELLCSLCAAVCIRRLTTIGFLEASALFGHPESDNMVRLWGYKRLRSDSDDAAADDCRDVDVDSVDYAKSNIFGRKKVSETDHRDRKYVPINVDFINTNAMRHEVT